MFKLKSLFKKKEAYKLPFAVLMECHGVYNDTYSVVENDEYPNAINNIANKQGAYCLLGRLDNNSVVTNKLVKVWTKDGMYHGVTKSGEHYVW